MRRWVPRVHVGPIAEYMPGWKALQSNLLSLLADRPSDRLLNPQEALFAQAGR